MRVLNKPYLKRKKACTEKLFLNLVLSLFSLGQLAICGDSDVALPGVDRAFWGGGNFTSIALFSHLLEKTTHFDTICPVVFAISGIFILWRLVQNVIDGFTPFQQAVKIYRKPMSSRR